MKRLVEAASIVLLLVWADPQVALAADRAGTSAAQSGIRDARDAVQRQQQQDEINTAPVTRKLKTRRRRNNDAGR